MEDKANTYSSAALAYLGDCAIELCVREYLVKEKGLTSSARLNKEALGFVRASAQAEAMKTSISKLYNVYMLLESAQNDICRKNASASTVLCTLAANAWKEFR